MKSPQSSQAENEKSLLSTAETILASDSAGKAFMDSIARSNSEDLLNELKKSSCG